jgi:DNA-directed RNA polymerase subunit RPC12/RpoP
MKKHLEPKTVTCQCGKTIEMTEESDWCTHCASKVFYHEKDQRRHKWHNLYIFGVILGVITFLTYVFIELIITPTL